MRALEPRFERDDEDQCGTDEHDIVEARFGRLHQFAQAESRKRQLEQRQTVCERSEAGDDDPRGTIRNP